MSFTESSQRDAKNRIKKSDSLLRNPPFERVMCFGTFDLFHPGHIYYVSEAGKLAREMTIVIARDHRVFSGK
jgi:bifunctional ADP-heptose synthase (sugar kinase/adenylyltransferase)